VVQTHPHSEAKAKSHLDRQGFLTYLPRYLKRRRHARRVDIVQVPLFPRYMFVAIDAAAHRWRSIRSTVGVSQLVCQGEDPALMSNDVVDELRRREDERGFIQLDLRPTFRQGERVRVLDGAFSNYSGLFEGMTGSERVAILLDLLGRKVRVVLDVESVATA
jgi:transcriptional antiterminator RfaH